MRLKLHHARRMHRAVALVSGIFGPLRYNGRVQVVWKAIAAAWEPYLGEWLAEERARNATTRLMLGGELTEERVADVLTRCFMAATKPMYKLPYRLTGSAVIDAVTAAVEALAALSDRGAITLKPQNLH